MFKFSTVKRIHLFFKDVGNACHFNKLDLCPVMNCLDYGKVQSFGRVAEDGLMTSNKQHWTAGHRQHTWSHSTNKSPSTQHSQPSVTNMTEFLYFLLKQLDSRTVCSQLG